MKTSMLSHLESSLLFPLQVDGFYDTSTFEPSFAGDDVNFEPFEYKVIAISLTTPLEIVHAVSSAAITVGTRYLDVPQCLVEPPAGSPLYGLCLIVQSLDESIPADDLRLNVTSAETTLRTQVGTGWKLNCQDGFQTLLPMIPCAKIRRDSLNEMGLNLRGSWGVRIFQITVRVVADVRNGFYHRSSTCACHAICCCVPRSWTTHSATPLSSQDPERLPNVLRATDEEEDAQTGMALDNGPEDVRFCSNHLRACIFRDKGSRSLASSAGMRSKISRKIERVPQIVASCVLNRGHFTLPALEEPLEAATEMVVLAGRRGPL
jgi:hypothetical protein